MVVRVGGEGRPVAERGIRLHIQFGETEIRARATNCTGESANVTIVYEPPPRSHL